MKGFIVLYNAFESDEDLLKIIGDSTNEILNFVCPDARENFLSFSSTIENKELLIIAMTYVYGKHLLEIQDFFGYNIDLHNFLHKVVIDD